MPSDRYKWLTDKQNTVHRKHLTFRIWVFKEAERILVAAAPHVQQTL